MISIFDVMDEFESIIFDSVRKRKEAVALELFESGDYGNADTIRAGYDAAEDVIRQAMSDIRMKNTGGQNNGR